MKNLLAATALTVAMPALVSAQTSNGCLPRADAVQKLTEYYSEVRRGLGLTEEGHVLGVWASEASGSWTVTLTGPNGMTCLAAWGESWSDFHESAGSPA